MVEFRVPNLLTVSFRNKNENWPMCVDIELSFNKRAGVVACDEGVIRKFDINAFMLKECTFLCLLVTC